MQTIGLFLSLGLLLIVSAPALRWLLNWWQKQRGTWPKTWPKQTPKQAKQIKRTKQTKTNQRPQHCLSCVHVCQSQTQKTSSCPAAEKWLGQFPQTKKIPAQK